MEKINGVIYSRTEVIPFTENYNFAVQTFYV
jgi:hypothetical protein